MPHFPDSCIAVLPIIIAHANEKREAWPGYARICSLAQVSRTTLHEALAWLVDNKWIAKFSRKTGKNTHNCYRLLWPEYDDSRKWIALHHDLIFSGVWGKMRTSDRKVYLMLRAHAWRGGHAIPDAFIGESPGDCIEDEQRGVFYDSNFLPAHIYDPATFRNLSGMNERTYRSSFSWLLDNGLVVPTCNSDDFEDGFLMPFRPGRHAPDIERQVAQAELAQTFDYVKASSGAKRSLTAAIRRKRLNDFGDAVFRREVLEVHVTDKRQ